MTNLIPAGQNLGLAWVAFALLAAGCLGEAGPPADDAEATMALDELGWSELGALVYSETHDHVDRDLHPEVRRNVELLGRSTLSADGRSLGEYNEADAANGIIAVAVVLGPEVDLRIILLDEAALPELRILGTFDEPGAYGDVKLDRGAPRAYVAYPLPTVPDGKAFAVWDLSQPDAPRRLGEVAGDGCHMLHPMRIGDQAYVWCSAIHGAQVYQIVDLADGTVTGVPLLPAEPVADPEVVRYTEYYAYLGTRLPFVVRVHDMTYQQDPLSGMPTLVTAHELQGIRLFDVSAPAAPRELSAWRGEGLGHPMDRVHTVGLADIGGKRIGFGATETFNNVPPALYIVDFTDYANPQFLAEWNPPGVLTDQRLTYSLHNFQVVGARLYISNFHAGLWVLDVADPAHPRELALSTPVWDTEYPRQGQMAIPGFLMAQNMYWDVLVLGGYVLATDMSSGVEVLHVEGDPLGDPAHRGGF